MMGISQIQISKFKYQINANAKNLKNFNNLKFGFDLKFDLGYLALTRIYFFIII
jgi:hypothetical protein